MPPLNRTISPSGEQSRKTPFLAKERRLGRCALVQSSVCPFKWVQRLSAQWPIGQIAGWPIPMTSVICMNFSYEEVRTPEVGPTGAMGRRFFKRGRSRMLRRLAVHGYEVVTLESAHDAKTGFGQFLGHPLARRYCQNVRKRTTARLIWKGWCGRAYFVICFAASTIDRAPMPK